MNWLVVESHELDAEGCLPLTDERAKYLQERLRQRTGSVIRAALVGGGRGWAHVVTCDEDRVVLRIEIVEPPPPPSGVSLLLAMPRPKAAKRLWAQLGELGIERVWITAAVGVEPSYFDSHALDPRVIRHRLKDGMAQSGETRLPIVEVCPRFEETLRRISMVLPHAEKLVFDSSFLETSDVDIRRPVLIAIGPERGWSQQELAQLMAAGFRGMSLGWRMLRTETACLVAIGRCMSI